VRTAFPNTAAQPQPRVARREVEVAVRAAVRPSADARALARLRIAKRLDRA
jgi:hypothetical protein